MIMVLNSVSALHMYYQSINQSINTRILYSAKIDSLRCH